MKQMEETIKAVGDFVENKIHLLKQDYLKKTGDASKVTATFSKPSSRVLPVSGENLDVTMGKILKYLSDMSSGMAFSKDYDQLSYKPIRSNFLLYHETANAAAYSDTIKGCSYSHAILLYGIGGASTSGTPRKKADFFRAYLIGCDRYANTSAGVSSDYGGELENGFPVEYAPMSIQIGSTGSTARWSITTQTSTQYKKFDIGITIPKGSWANIQALRIPFYTAYANDK